MHPYSEYLQEYILERNGLDKGGKFKGDFRITGWGKILRRYWLDELLMIINLFKGDLKIVESGLCRYIIIIFIHPN